MVNDCEIAILIFMFYQLHKIAKVIYPKYVFYKCSNESCTFAFLGFIVLSEQYSENFFNFAEVSFRLGFPTGRDSATFQDKGTKIHSLSRDKETTG